MRAGGAAHFGLQSEHVAMLCASHSGESAHVSAVSDILAFDGCQPAELRCGCNLPIAIMLPGAQVPAGFPTTDMTKNSLGKHAGILDHCPKHVMSRITE